MGKQSVFDVIEQIFSLGITGILTAGIGVFITVEVLSRLFLNYSFQGLVDLVELYCALLAFLSLAIVQADRGHITVDILPLKLKPYRAGLILDCVQLAMGILIMAFLLVEVTWFLFESIKINNTTLTLFWPVWPFVGGMIVGIFLYILRMVRQFKDSFSSAVAFDPKFRKSSSERK